MERQLVSVSREWHNPFIRVDVTEVGIGITMTAEDFLIALAQEAGLNPAAVLKAGDAVIAKMKKESAKVM